jgi:hypothetical protein
MNKAQLLVAKLKNIYSMCLIGSDLKCKGNETQRQLLIQF